MAKPLFALAAGVRLVLASGSPRRRQFLEEWGVPFEVRPAPAEPQPLPGERPDDHVLRSACAKLAAAGRGPGEVVVAADTVVAHAGHILGKPRDDAEALAMLLELSGTDHTVSTGVAVALPDGSTRSFVDTCTVTFHAWPRDLLAAYVATGECRDKAGAYAIQGIGAFLVEKVHGSWSTVVGLPVSRLAALLMEGGLIVPAVPAKE